MNIEDRLDAKIALAKAKLELQRTERLRLFQPYEPQREFFKLGNSKRERLFMAGNQTGKSHSGAFEMACHLTGVYPAWWEGKRFTTPVLAWTGGMTTGDVRNINQAKLFGKPGVGDDEYDGLVPRAAILGKTSSHGAGDAYDSVRIKHASGKTSIIWMKTYAQGAETWQGATLDTIWLDEEPPKDIYDEALTRLTGTGMIFTTCTPLHGPTDFIKHFIQPDTPAAEKDRGVARMGLRHVKHFTDEQKETRLAGYSARDRAARENGDPILQGGRIFNASEDQIRLVAPPGFMSHIAPHWPRIWGIDFGWAHPFAAALCAWDKERDAFYVLHTIRMKEAIPLQHADAMKRIAINVPVAWPHDGTHTEKGSGEPLAATYKSLGLKMLQDHATHAGGGYQVEPGLVAMDNMMLGGRFKVADNCYDFFEEYRMYRYDDRPGHEGKIIKVNDDTIDAVRCAFMMRRYAKAVPFGGEIVKPRRPTGSIMNPFTGKATLTYN